MLFLFNRKPFPRLRRPSALPGLSRAARRHAFAPGVIDAGPRRHVLRVWRTVSRLLVAVLLVAWVAGWVLLATWLVWP